MRVISLLLLLLVVVSSPVLAQDAGARVTVRVLLDERALAGARVAAPTDSSLTNAAGEATLRLAAGTHVVRVHMQGIAPAEQSIRVRAATDTVVVIAVEEDAVDLEAIIVSSTRSERRIEDEPVRVEVIGREEVEEKLLMTPGDIAMLLNETAGLRVQPAAPSLGGAGVRIQGLRGRYTQVLSDGLPLFGAQTGALGPLQIPPMDLRQVEIIKGAASALYGASALGGVVNLISRLPQEEPERELLLNASTLGGVDGIAWTSQELNDAWGYTLLLGAHQQRAADVDDDGWADVPSFKRVVLRPRLFWNNDRGASALFTIGGMLEDRSGGAVEDVATPTAPSYVDALDTRRVDAGVIARMLLNGSRLLSVRGSATLQRHHHHFDDVRERDTHTTMFTEAALSGASGAHTWVVGAVVQQEKYRARDVSGFDYTFAIPGVFAQDEFSVSDRLTLSGSVRVDHHSEYGAFVNPRFSALLRPADAWTVRTSVGTGYFAPTPWIEETESVGLNRIVSWRGLDAERARNASLDIGRVFGALELNASAFASQIDHAVQARQSATDAGMLELFNAQQRVRTYGTELLARYHVEGIHVTATHVFMRSTEPDPNTAERRDVPLTPRHAFGIVAALEREDRGRIGAELYYTGRQELEDNPYRNVTPDHVIVGFLVERHFGPIRAFLNAENVFDTRQTRYDPLLLPARSPEGRWTTDVWAPLEGRSFNAGVRWFVQ